jgi:hypothetical protein
MTTGARLYVYATVVLGLTLLCGCLIWFGQFPDVAQYLAYFSLACIAAMLKVRLPGLKGTISVNFVFILIAVVELSLAETVILAFVATLVQCLWRPKTWPSVIQVLFNASAVVISAVLAYGAARAMPLASLAWISLAPAATVFFVLNTGMVSLVLALISKTHPLAVWKQCHLWTSPYYLVGAATAAAIGTSAHIVGWRLSLTALPLMYLVYLYYRDYVSSQTARALAGLRFSECSSANDERVESTTSR